MQLTSEYVLGKIQEHKTDIKRFGVRRLGLFGSVARGDASDKSDLDILVDLEHHTFDAYMDLKFFLEDLFGRHVDLVMTDSIKPRLRAPIMREVVYVQGL